MTSTNTFITSKQKSDAANKGRSAIEEQIQKIITNVVELQNEKSFIDGSESVTLSVIETLEKQLEILRNQQKKSRADLIIKNDIIKQQSAALESLKAGSTSASQYEKETEDAKQNYLTSSQNYKIELDKDFESSFSAAGNELLNNINFEKFKELVEKII